MERNSGDLWRAMGGALLCMIPLTVVLSVGVTRALHMREWMYGWGMAVANVGLSVAIYAYAMKKSGNAFLVWALGVNGVRSLCMVGAVLGVLVLVGRHPLPYLIAALTGTACLMAAEVYYLYRRLA